MIVASSGHASLLIHTVDHAHPSYRMPTKIRLLLLPDARTRPLLLPHARTRPLRLSDARTRPLLLPEARTRPLLLQNVRSRPLLLPDAGTRPPPRLHGRTPNNSHQITRTYSLHPPPLRPHANKDTSNSHKQLPKDTSSRTPKPP